jgi:hypothetical protein
LLSLHFAFLETFLPLLSCCSEVLDDHVCIREDADLRLDA